jgi:hypothetical protein
MRKQKLLSIFFSFLDWNGTVSTITEATTGLLYQLRMMSVELSVECLVGETEVLGENLPQCHLLF